MAEYEPSGWTLGLPYGDDHQNCCSLFRGLDYCDCAASDASSVDWESVPVEEARKLIERHPRPTRYQP